MNKFQSVTKSLRWFMALLVVAFVAGCGGSSGIGVAPSSTKAITAYSLVAYPAAVVTINEPLKTIAVIVPSGTSVKALVAKFTSTGAGSPTVGGVNQVSGTTPNDFTLPKPYIVTAADGTTATYTVTVTVASISAKDISSFSFAAYPAAIGTITGSASPFDIAVTVPSGTVVTNLVATFATTGTGVKVAAVSQVSGTTANDFTTPKAYVVTAADSTTATYRVTVTVASASAKAIGSYSFATIPGAVGVISGSASPFAIAVPVPNGTSLTGLNATFVTTGVSVTVGGLTQVSGTTLNNFPAAPSSLAYTVHAADGTTAIYNVTVNVASATTVLPGAGTNPTVLSSSPTVGDISVPTSSNSTIAAANNTQTGKLVTATFSEAMDPTTITPVGVFTLKETIAGTNVAGAVTMNAANTMGHAANMVATFKPTVALSPNTGYTATITTAAKTAGNVAITKSVAWSFTTNSVALIGQEPVDLLSILTNNLVILSKTGITQAVPTPNSITGNIGASPTTGGSITVACTDLVAGSGIGQMFTVDATPTGTCVSADKTAAAIAVADMGTAYTEAGGRTNPTPAVLASDITNLTLNPGIHTTASGVILNVGTGAGVTLDCLGDSNAVFIFQIATTLTVGPGAPVTLAGSCQAKNVFWVVQGAAAIDTPLDTTSKFKGNLLTFTTIALNAGATINGRLLSQTQVTLNGNAVGP